MHLLATNLEDLLGGVFILVVAAGILWLNPRHPSTRAFALFLGVFGLATIQLEDVLHRGAHAGSRLDGVAAMALPFALVGFLARFPRARPRLAGRVGTRALLLGALLLGGLVAARPTLWETLSPDGQGGWSDDVTGPLGIVGSVNDAMLPLAAIVLVVQAVRGRGAEARSLLLVAAGLAMEPATNSGVLALDLAGQLGYAPQERAEWIAAEVGEVVLLAAIFAFAWAAAKLPREDRTLSLAVGAGLAGLFAATAFLTIGPLDGNAPLLGTALRLQDPLLIVGTVTFPILIAIAVVRHQLLDVQVKLRGTISRTTVALVVLAVFFVAAQIAQTFLSDAYGVVAGGAAAGLLLFALAPLQRLAERVADSALPATAGKAGHEAIFRRAVRYALRGGVTREEERHLAELAAALKIDAATALQLREDVEREAAS